MGARPTETLEKNSKGGDAGEKKEEQLPDASKEEIVDLTVGITDTMSGKAMCFAEQMEMEPEPNEDSVNQTKQSSGEHECQQEPSQSSSEAHNTQNGHSTSETHAPTADEASALFDGPPPGNGIFASTSQQATNEEVASREHSTVPPPPYLAYTSPYPQQSASAANVDLR